MSKPTLGFVGAGKVGHTLARLWYRAGYRVVAVYSRTADHSAVLAQAVDAQPVDSASEVVQRADLTLLTVPDDSLESVVASMEGLQANSAGETKAVIHTSGARDHLVLQPLAHKGLLIGSLHPIFPFANVESAVAGLPGAIFGVEANSEVLRDWLEDMVVALSGRILDIPAGGKAAYHSAFVFASNYVVTLYAIAERLLVGLGADRSVADHALNVLLAGTVENLRREGVPAALTGPLVRRDIQTVKAHLAALEGIDDELAELYRRLAWWSLPMLAARQIDTTFMEQLLDREQNDASDHS